MPANPHIISGDKITALIRAEVSVRHAVEVLDNAGVVGMLRDDTELIAERFSKLLTRPDGKRIGD